jgi:uncharacterized protein (TIGR00297 family)
VHRCALARRPVISSTVESVVVICAVIFIKVSGLRRGYLKGNFDGFLKTFLTLDVVGVLAALALGLLILFFGGAEGLNFLLVLFLFLVVSAIVTRFKKGRKVAMKTYEKARGWKNVLANGAVPVIIAFFYFLNVRYLWIPELAIIVAYVASVAAITADKFSSEIGILDGNVVMLLTLKRIRPGISGGVSLLGVVAGLFGAFIIGLSLFSFQDFLLFLGVVALAGIAGDLVDSMLGYFEEKDIGNKYTSNLACGIVGGLLALILTLLILAA